MREPCFSFCLVLIVAEDNTWLSSTWPSSMSEGGRDWQRGKLKHWNWGEIVENSKPVLVKQAGKSQDLQGSGSGKYRAMLFWLGFNGYGFLPCLWFYVGPHFPQDSKFFTFLGKFPRNFGDLFTWGHLDYSWSMFEKKGLQLRELRNWKGREGKENSWTKHLFHFIYFFIFLPLPPGGKRATSAIN